MMLEKKDRGLQGERCGHREKTVSLGHLRHEIDFGGGAEKNLPSAGFEKEGRQPEHYLKDRYRGRVKRKEGAN